jgi:hypothetical protein
MRFDTFHTPLTYTRRVWSHLDESTMIKDYLDDSMLPFYAQLMKLFGSLRTLKTKR